MIALNLEYKVFVIHIVALNINLGDKMHLSKKAQIANLKADEALIKIPRKYANFANIFLPKLTTKLLKYTRINNHAI